VGVRGGLGVCRTRANRETNLRKKKKTQEPTPVIMENQGAQRVPSEREGALPWQGGTQGERTQTVTRRANTSPPCEGDMTKNNKHQNEKKSWGASEQ